MARPRLAHLRLGLLLAIPASLAAQAAPDAQQIEEALSALPEALREDATVYGYDADNQLVQLREGRGDITCRADDPTVRSFIIECYPAALADYVDRSQALRKEGADTPARLKTLTAEVAAGAITIPAGAVEYTRTGNSARLSENAVILFLPNATAESTGLSTLPSATYPFLASPGTPIANVRITIPED